MLIRTPELGAALARSLGGAAYALMRGHGSVAVGMSVKQVVYRAIYAEVNARLQSEAGQLGKITFLTDAEAANAAATNDQMVDRPWELWKKRVSGPQH
jgi:HCOMODA/2-hydroxy-3-carboxy-muconic semialdehyde decarboxylase